MSVFQIFSFPPRTLQTETCPTPRARRHPGDSQIMPGIGPSPHRTAPLSDAPCAGTLRPRRPTPARRCRLYRHFALGFKLISQDEEIIEPQFPTCRAVRSDRLPVHRTRLRHSEWPSATVPEMLFLLRHALVPAGFPRRYGGTGAPGQMNGGCAPGSGRFVVSYINRYLMTINDPLQIFDTSAKYRF
jgi:hypothetical protein